MLDFQQPVSGVVGPNGCDKSNIVDAIRVEPSIKKTPHPLLGTAFFYTMIAVILSYLCLRLRQMARPAKPPPMRIKLEGSGTGEFVAKIFVEK